MVTFELLKLRMGSSVKGLEFIGKEGWVPQPWDYRTFGLTTCHPELDLKMKR